MRAAAEYRKHAEECRRLAQQMVAPEDKRALEELADRWEMLEKLRDRNLVPEN
jgi:plasmid stability protein